MKTTVKTTRTLIVAAIICVGLSSCVSKKKLVAAEADLTTCRLENDKLTSELIDLRSKNNLGNQKIESLQDQLADCKEQRDQQLSQVGDLTVISKSANENIKETLAQLESKDKYIRLLYAARTKADSINLALAVNLKSVLKKGIEDEDVVIEVDKTVVLINLSDSMLYQSGSYQLTVRAKEVLGKIAQIVKSRPDLEVMVEGYTDNVPINTECIDDNWDLSVKRSTSVVRALQEDYNIDPNRLIAAGRGEYNTLASNKTSKGRAINRRTRIIIMPKLDQFYDLLDPEDLPNE
jgi:chemotaxis protein MotB